MMGVKACEELAHRMETSGNRLERTRTNTNKTGVCFWCVSNSIISDALQLNNHRVCQVKSLNLLFIIHNNKNCSGFVLSGCSHIHTTTKTTTTNLPVGLSASLLAAALLLLLLLLATAAVGAETALRLLPTACSLRSVAAVAAMLAVD